MKRAEWTFPREDRFSPFHSWRFLRFGPYDPSCRTLTKVRWQRLFWRGEELVRFTFGASGNLVAAVLECPESAPDFEDDDIKGCLGLNDLKQQDLPLPDSLKRIDPQVRLLSLVRVLWPYEALLAMILQQRVSWKEAASNWVSLCKKHGTRWGNLTSPPSPRKLLTLSDAQLAACGIERARAVPCREAARRLGNAPCLSSTPEEIGARLSGGSGLGPWTINYFRGLFWADSDVIPTGDYDLPHLVSYVLEGKRKGSDERMVELLEPFRGQRFRIIRWLLGSGMRVPRRAPRLPFGSGVGESN